MPTTSTDCLLGHGYRAPGAGALIDSSIKTDIQWEIGCWNQSNNLDLYLYLESSDRLLPIHGWRNLPTNRAHARITLEPRWWVGNVYQSSNTTMFLTLVEHGNQPWDTANPYGPVFTTSYVAPAPGHSPPSDATHDALSTQQNVMSTFSQGGHLTEAGKTAAIVGPIILVVVVVVVVIRLLHIRTNNKTAEFSDQMDQRMSRISIDWCQGGDGSLGLVPGSRPASLLLPPADTTGRWPGAPLVVPPQPTPGGRRSVTFPYDPPFNHHWISATQQLAEPHPTHQPEKEHSYAYAVTGDLGQDTPTDLLGPQESLAPNTYDHHRGNGTGQRKRTMHSSALGPPSGLRNVWALDDDEPSFNTAPPAVPLVSLSPSTPQEAIQPFTFNQPRAMPRDERQRHSRRGFPANEQDVRADVLDPHQDNHLHVGLGETDAQSVTDDDMSVLDGTIVAVPASDLESSQCPVNKWRRFDLLHGLEFNLRSPFQVGSISDLQSFTLTDTTDLGSDGLRHDSSMYNTLDQQGHHHHHRHSWDQASEHSQLGASCRRGGAYCSDLMDQNDAIDLVGDLPRVERSKTLYIRAKARHAKREQRMQRLHATTVQTPLVVPNSSMYSNSAGNTGPWVVPQDGGTFSVPEQPIDHPDLVTDSPLPPVPRSQTFPDQWTMHGLSVPSLTVTDPGTDPVTTESVNEFTTSSCVNDSDATDVNHVNQRQGDYGSSSFTALV